MGVRRCVAGALEGEASEEEAEEEEAGKVQSLTRFTPEDVDEFERSSEGKVLKTCFFMLALLYMWPYQTLLQTQNFLIAKFPAMKNTIGNTMMIATTWPFLLTHVVMTFSGLSRRFPYRCKILVPGVIVACIAVYLIIIFFLCSDARALLPSLYGAALLVSLVEGITEPAVYDMAGLFPSALTSERVQAGNGACGLVVSCVGILTRLLTSGVKPLGEGQLQKLAYVYFFLMSLAGLGVPLIYFFVMRRTSLYRRYVAGEARLPSEDSEGLPAPRRDGGEATRPSTEGSSSSSNSSTSSQGSFASQEPKGPAPLAAAAEALGHLWQSTLAVVLTFGTTLALWPVIPGRACLNADPGADLTLRSWWFDIVIFTFNLCDFLGKSEGRSLSWGAKVMPPGLQLACAVIRGCVFFPLLLTSSAPQSYEPTVARWVSLASVALLGLSNGWLSTVCFMRGPKALPAGSSNVVAEQASTVLVIGLFTGISLGVFTAYELGQGPLAEDLGACYNASLSASRR